MTSEGARGGFKNEAEVIGLLNSFDPVTFPWLEAMGFDISRITQVIAEKGRHKTKPDVVVRVLYKSEKVPNEARISVKKQSSTRGFNQVDRGDVVRRYKVLWPMMPEKTVLGLKYFTGLLPPIGNSRNHARMFLDELPTELLSPVISFFEQNKSLVIKDLLAGREPDQADFFMSTDSRGLSVVAPMAQVLRSAAEGPVALSPRGSLMIGKILAQRKGGDGGRDTAKNLQFKADPLQLIEA